MTQLRQNILRSGEVGRLVSDDYRSSIVQAPLIDRDPTSGEPLNYWELSQSLEQEIRDKYEQLSVGEDGQPTVKIHIIGFAKIIGDLLDGITAIFWFAIITLLVTSMLLFLYTGSLRGALTPLFCSIIAVIWQLGLLTTLGYGLNAYSILIPFLVFAIGVSHGVQIINAFLGESIAGKHRLDAAKRAVQDTVYTGHDRPGIRRHRFHYHGADPHSGDQGSRDRRQRWRGGNRADQPGAATGAYVLYRDQQQSRAATGPTPHRTRPRYRLALAVQFRQCQGSAGFPADRRIGFAIGIYGGQNLKIGDLDPGAPELHPDSRYNLDNQFITDNYATSSDIMVVLVETEGAAMHAVQQSGPGRSLHLAYAQCTRGKLGHGRHRSVQTGRGRV